MPPPRPKPWPLVCKTLVSPESRPRTFLRTRHRKSHSDSALSVAQSASVTIVILFLVPEDCLARLPKTSASLKKRAAQIQVLIMDVDGTMTDGSVTLLSQPDGTALEIKSFDAHDGQGLTLARTAG